MATQNSNGLSAPRGADFTLLDEFTIFLLTPVSEAARDWVAEFLPSDATTFGRATVVEHRYIGDIVEGIINDGLTVEET
jgi:hypothetical protein